MEDMYSFLENRIRENFEVEALLKSSLRGKVTKLRHRDSHRRYVCRSYYQPSDIYLRLLDKECSSLPRIYEAAVRQPEDAGSCGHKNYSVKDEPVKQNEPVRQMSEITGDQFRMLVLEEYVAGDTLDLLLQAGPLTVRQARDISLQLCRGLYVLHSLGWVHRDIKPENVILRGDQAVLIDFDAARNYVPGKEQDTMILGTVGYAPPEQYGLTETDFRSDIYAMGVLINEMLTGCHPSQTLAKGRWGRIISRCTMIQPDKRFTSVKDLMEAL